MASSPLHFQIGLVVSGFAATSVFAVGLVTPAQMLACVAVGALGSVLPDLDANGSAPRQLASVLVALTLAFGAMFHVAAWLGSVVELLLVWAVAYACTRIALHVVVRRMVVHRGLLHSVPAALFSGLATAVVLERVGGRDPFECWLLGGFSSLGYGVHLLVDECASLNPLGMRTRRSLGTAVTLWPRRAPFACAMLYAGCIALAVAAPPVDSVLEHGAIARPQWIPAALEHGQLSVRARQWLAAAPGAG